ncbi:MAG: DUF4159 domain-containing protein [Nitrospinota bacterium]|nr:MAG: DUF4159 domain-containing protein [Nitrospinota bacterium]
MTIPGMTRRRFLQQALLLTSLLVGGKPLRGAAQEERPPSSPFIFTQVRYRGGDWDPHPYAARSILEEVERRTSIEVRKERQVITLLDPDLFSYPFLYLAGGEPFEPFTEEEVEVLRLFLTYGGFLLIEDTMGYKGLGFDRFIREQIRRIFPDRALERLPHDHTVYRSFYLIQSVGGRRIVNPYLEGVNVDNWTPLIYSQNDLAGAWERDFLGNWKYDVIPGGEAQRFQAFMLGVNLIMYALTENYKQDRIHIPFINRKLG